MTFRTESLWRATHQLRRFAPLAGDRIADVVVVGCGISGLTAAVLLARSGQRVSVIERDHIGSGETGNTTAHLTEAVDARYQTLVKDFGEENARLVAASKRAAIDRIAAFTRADGADCGFSYVPGYLYTERRSDLEWLSAELDAARLAGCRVERVDRAPLPFDTAGAIRWERQAQVHATAYLNMLVREATGHGVRVYENTR